MSLMHCICLLYMMRLHIVICNDDYKFTAYPYSILLEFAVDDEVVITIHFARFSPKTVRKLHARHTNSYRVLRRITFIIRSWIPYGS